MSKYRQIFAFVILLTVVAAYIVYDRPMLRGLDLAGGMRVVYETRPTTPEQAQNVSIQTIASILDRRINGYGIAESTVQPKGTNQVIVEIPDVKDHSKEELAQRLVQPTKLEFRYFKNVQSGRNPNAPYRMEVDGDVYTFYDREGNEVPHEKIIAESELILTGADLKDNAIANIEGVQSVVLVEFQREGRQKFAEFTRRHVNDHLAIILNDQILSVPTINEPILQGKARISGRFTTQEAQTFAQNLNAGALPVPLEIVEQNIVEATLGAQYVDQSIKAGIWGLVLVCIFMAGYYLLPGVLAVIALCLYALFTFAVFKSLGVVMTLPGLAGFILSIGMAVDANILIFERLKEELRAGKTLHSAIDAGFSRAWTAILDSNVCTLITCMILLALTAGPVKGFALTLAIGVLISMFTAITVSRTLLHIVSNMRFAQNARLYGLGRQIGAHTGVGRGLDIIGKRAIFFSFSTVMIVIGLFFIASGGLKPGIEFTGGSMVQLGFDKPVTVTEVRRAAQSAGMPEAQVQISRDGDRYSAFVRTREMTQAQQAGFRAELEKSLPGSKVESYSLIGPSISKEIKTNSIIAIILACILICIYLSVRFAQGGFQAGFKFGACALFALGHDVLFVLGAAAFFGKMYGWQIDAAFVTAILTVIGYSVHDTIVIFDRIRENTKLRLKGETFEQMVNRSILQSFARSINTSLTVVLVLATLLLFGGAVIRHFNAILMVGIVLGTYSSIFNASPLLVIWERKARAAKGQLTASEMKPMVSTPDPAAVSLVGGSDDKSESASDTASQGEAKHKANVKRRKRRF